MAPVPEKSAEAKSLFVDDRLKWLEYAFFPYSARSGETQLDEWLAIQRQEDVAALRALLHTIPIEFAREKQLGAFIGGTSVFSEQYWGERKATALQSGERDLLPMIAARGNDIDVFFGSDLPELVEQVPDGFIYHSPLLDSICKFLERSAIPFSFKRGVCKNGTLWMEPQRLERGSDGKIKWTSPGLTLQKMEIKSEALKIRMPGARPLHVRHFHKAPLSARIAEERKFGVPLVVLFECGGFEKALVRFSGR